MDPLGISLPKTGFYLPSVDRSRPQTQRAAKNNWGSFSGSPYGWLSKLGSLFGYPK